MTLREYAGRIYFALSFLAFAGVLVASSQPPLLRDYPDWVYQGVLLAKTLSGHPVPGYALKLYPVPNSITTVGLALLTLVFGWLWAAKLWMLVYLSVAASTIFVVARTFALPSWLWWAMPCVLFFGQNFWFGTVSFSLGVCALLLLLSLLHRQREGVVPIFALIVVCFFLHLIVYAAAGLMILLYCLQHWRWKLTLVGLATLPLPVWYFLGRRAEPSDESALGSSPAAHLAVPALAALAFLALAAWRRGPELSRWVARFLLVAASLLTAITLLASLVLGSRLASPLFLVRLKTLDPLQLFGFVNIIYFPTLVPLLSATLALFGRPLFLVLLCLDLVCGILFLLSLVAVLLRFQPASLSPSSRPPVFVLNFVALFGMLYLLCPPNALGVISIDLRLAQLAFAAGLIAFASNLPRAWFKPLVWAAIPLILLLIASLVEFTVSQHRATLPGRDTASLPAQLATFSAVDPTAIADEYDRLRSGRLEGFIFATGLFYQTQYWPHGMGPGR